MAASLAVMPAESNCIKRPAGPNPKRVVRVSEDFPIDKLKIVCKRNRCTMNQLVHTYIGKALHQYALNRGDTTLKSITVGSTFALKGFPENAKGITGGNFWVPQYLSVPVGNDF